MIQQILWREFIGAFDFWEADRRTYKVFFIFWQLFPIFMKTLGSSGSFLLWRWKNFCFIWAYSLNTQLHASMKQKFFHQQNKKDPEDPRTFHKNWKKLSEISPVVRSWEYVCGQAGWTTGKIGRSIKKSSQKHFTQNVPFSSMDDQPKNKLIRFTLRADGTKRPSNFHAPHPISAFVSGKKFGEN